MNDACSPHDATAPQVPPSFPRYAGVWRRLLASLIDGLVLMPAAALVCWAFSSRTAALFVIPYNVSFHLYRVVMHAHGGQTVGKLAARIRVVTTSGRRISWGEALLRDSASLAFTALATTSLVVAATLIPHAAEDPGWRETVSLLQAAEPSWGRWANAASVLWLCIDSLVLLANNQRRSLHDFIAGTAVIRIRREANGSLPRGT